MIIAEISAKGVSLRLEKVPSKAIAGVNAMMPANGELQTHKAEARAGLAGRHFEASAASGEEGEEGEEEEEEIVVVVVAAVEEEEEEVLVVVRLFVQVSSLEKGRQAQAL